MKKRSLKKLPLAKATMSLAEAAENLNGVALALTVKGKPVAALVPVEGMDWESLAVGTSPTFLDIIERSRRSYEEHGGYSDEEIRREFGLPPFDLEKAKTSARKRPGTAKPKTKN